MRRVEPGAWWAVGLALLALGRMPAAEAPLIAPENRLDPAAAEWRALVEQFAKREAIVADFEERRVFPFRGEPVILRGQVRVSPTRGLSLHYAGAQERTIVIDEAGMLVRERRGQRAPPVDPRANLANEAMRSILRMDFARLAQGYELYGRQDGAAWSLGLVPRDAGTRRAIGDIFVEGEGTAVRRIELRRSARQHVTIEMSPPRETRFTAEEEKTFFR